MNNLTEWRRVEWSGVQDVDCGTPSVGHAVWMLCGVKHAAAVSETLVDTGSRPWTG